MTQKFRLVHAEARRRAANACMTAPDGYTVTVKEADKSREQEERYHAMLGDIAKQCQHLNQVLDLDSWKRLCVDLFRKESMADPRMAEYWSRNGVRFIPSLDGTGVVALGEQTRRFPKYVATAFIEWLFAFGVEREVVWTDPMRVEEMAA